MDKVVSCGFDKWSMVVNKDGSVSIVTCYHPVYQKLDLHDASSEDLKKLSAMFMMAAMEIENVLQIKR